MTKPEIDAEGLALLIARAEDFIAHPNVHFHYKDGAEVMQGLVDALLAATRTSEAAEPVATGHEWEPSPYGHGSARCKHCKSTLEELIVLGERDRCASAPHPSPVSEEVTGALAGLIERYEEVVSGAEVSCGLNDDAWQVARAALASLRSPNP